jgi:hypothetical protein
MARVVLESWYAKFQNRAVTIKSQALKREKFMPGLST